MGLAYPDETSILGQHMACELFLTAFDDQELDLKIRERESEPRDLHNAYTDALRFESC